MIRYPILFIALFAIASIAQADDSQSAPTLLFVQTAGGVTLDGKSLTLKDAGKTTLFFSDRPERIAGHMASTEFVDSWGEGKDSFASDPPNATLSVFSGDDVHNVVVELREPKWSGDDLVYDVTLLEGDVPTLSGPGSLFIDIIGMPLTPLSYAGVARRRRRAFVYGGAAMAAYAARPTTVVVQPSAAPPAHSSTGENTEQKMQELQDMYDKGLINQAEYDQKKQQLLNDM